MPNSATVIGTTLRLVPFADAHITDTYLGWLNDRALMRFSRQRHITHTRSTSRDYLASFGGTENAFWAMERVDDGEIVGSMTMYLDAADGVADLGMLVGVSGRGYGTEAWGLGLRYAFGDRGVRKVTGGTVAGNIAVVRFFERWQMVREGTQREQTLLDDGPADVLLYGLLRREWEAGITSPR